MRRESGTSGPYSVERPTDRETYQDGDRGLTGLWRDRPYSDVEQPKADPCPDKDAEDNGVSPRRLRWDEIARGVARAAADEDADEDAGEGADAKKEYKADPDLEFGSPQWTRVAPLVDGVTNAMYENDSRDKLESNLDSKGVSNLSLIMEIVDRAESKGFGFRYTKKVWENFIGLVPLCGRLKQAHYRDLVSDALGKLGVEKVYPFQGEPSHKGFEQTTQFGKMTGGDPQEVYEERVPGRMPSLETKNVEGWLRLHDGEGLGEMAEEAWKTIVSKKIVDPKTGTFYKQRLQSMLRYAYDMPDSNLARAIMVAIVVRDAMRIVSGTDTALASALAGGASGLTADALVSGMQGMSKELVDRWLDIAISTMHYVGVLPTAEPSDGEEEPGGEEEPDGGDGEPKSLYGPVRDAMRRNLASIAVNITDDLFKGVGRQSADQPAGAEQQQGTGQQQGPDKAEVEATVEAFNQAVRKAIRSISPTDDATPDSSGVRSALQALRAATSGGDIGAMADASASAVGALSEMGARRGDPGFDEAREAAENLRQALGLRRARRAASSTVAELVKRILSPAKSRVVDRSEAEDGIELADGQELTLPSRYHSVSQALGGASCRSR